MPILKISVGEGIDGNPLFGHQSIVTGAVLDTSPDSSFQDGTYSMTVTTGTADTRRTQTTTSWRGSPAPAPSRSPSSHPFSGVTCSILYSTSAKGEEGTAYEVVFTLRGLDIGAH